MRKMTRAAIQVESLEGRALMAAGPITPNQVLVAEYYELYLHRPVDPAGLATWTSQLSKGVSPQTVGQEIINSTEGRSVYIVADYQFYLNRSPSAAETTAWVSYLAKGNTTDQLDAEIMASPEFYTNSGGTVPGFLAAVYTDELSRDIDAPSEAYWAGLMAKGVTPTAVALGVATSHEQAVGEITFDYQNILGRDADPAGLNYYVSLREGVLPKITREQANLDLLNSKENLARINGAIATSTETDTPDSLAQSLLQKDSEYSV
jgi:hypothetical protein